jgi:hypothetical protein
MVQAFLLPCFPDDLYCCKCMADTEKITDSDNAELVTVE